MPFFQRIKQSLFGSKESKEAEEQREEKTQQRLKELQERQRYELDVVAETDKKGTRYEVAPIVDPSTNKDYVVASTWDGLESVGSEAWVKARADRGEQYQGYGGELIPIRTILTRGLDSSHRSAFS